MPIYVWIVCAVIVVSSLATVASIGKPRKPLSAGTAVAVLIVNGLLVWAVVAAGSR